MSGSFWGNVAAGLGASGWAIGFLAGFGGFLVILGIIGYALTYAMSDDGETETEEEHEREDQQL